MSYRSRTHLFRRVRGRRPSEREHEGPSWRCAGGRSAAAGPCGRERVMSQMTQTLTSTPPTDDLVVPFHCDRCGALAKVDRKSTRLNSSHANISYAVFCLKKKKTKDYTHKPY